jgi:hypothetical protein
MRPTFQPQPVLSIMSVFSLTLATFSKAPVNGLTAPWICSSWTFENRTSAPAAIASDGKS